MINRFLARILKRDGREDSFSAPTTPTDAPQGSGPQSQPAAAGAERPIIIHKAALQAEDPFVPLEMVSRFVYVLIKERGYSPEELPPRAFALFVAGKFIFKITEETFSSWLETMGPLKPEWPERAAAIFEQAGLAGYANALRELAAWMREHPGVDPARALAEGDPVLTNIKAMSRQLAREIPPARIWPALLGAVRTWPELLVVDAATEEELMAVFDRYYPPRAQRKEKLSGTMRGNCPEQ